MGSPRTTEAPVDVPFGQGSSWIRRLLGAVAAGTVLLLLVLAFLSHALGASPPWAGPVGERLASVLFAAFGLGAWALLLEGGLLVRRLATGRGEPLGALGPVAGLAALLCLGAAAHLAWPGETLPGGHRIGGASGELLGELLRSAFGRPGGLLLAAAATVAAWTVRAPGLVWSALRLGVGALGASWRGVRGAARAVREAWRQAAELDALEGGGEGAERAPEEAGEARDGGATDVAPPSVERDVGPEAAGGPMGRADDAPATIATRGETGRAARRGRTKAAEAEAADERGDSESLPRHAEAAPKRSAAPRIVSPRAEQVRRPAVTATPAASGDGFSLPGAELLTEPPAQQLRIDEAALGEQAERLTEALRAYGIQGTVDEIRPGPVVTMFEYTPKQGTKLSRISALSGDLAMALAAPSVRIVAPIPGKGRVGFEVPNETRQTVWLRELFEDERWHRFDAALPLVLGRDIAGQPVYADLSRMPHLLVAGTTGSGKSVGINVMLLSLLVRRSPEELRLLMVDPKVVELAPFNGIPHMLLPVVTDMSQAARALRWAVDEMERRYQLFADAGTRGIAGYNKLVAGYEAGSVPLERFHGRKRKQQDAQAAQEAPARLPHIVVVVDEFADLMAVAAKEVETSVARLAQKARAAGIHVILATQRPSVDIITGLIKANFPARIAFRVMQGVDSKTILGRVGAEQLLGQGDMLFLPPGGSDLRRVHGAFVSEEEVHRVCDFLRAQGEPQYDERILEAPEEETGGAAESGGGDDLYQRAVQIVTQAGYCSTSFLQRKLGIGYNRAANLVERMEEAGIVGPPAKAGGRREVFLS